MSKTLPFCPVLSLDSRRRIRVTRTGHSRRRLPKPSCSSKPCSPRGLAWLSPGPTSHMPWSPKPTHPRTINGDFSAQPCANSTSKIDVGCWHTRRTNCWTMKPDTQTSCWKLPPPMKAWNTLINTSEENPLCSSWINNRKSNSVTCTRRRWPDSPTTRTSTRSQSNPNVPNYCQLIFGPPLPMWWRPWGHITLC